jgi:predicted nucleic acid-binding protein
MRVTVDTSILIRAVMRNDQKQATAAARLLIEKQGQAARLLV